MKYLFLSIITIVIANVGLGHIAKNYHSFSAMISWFAFGSILSIFWAKNELLKKETYKEILKHKMPAISFLILSIAGPILYFLAIKDAGLGITSVISNSKFGILIIASFLIFKEKPNKNDILAITLLIPGFILLTELKDVKYNYGVFLAALSMVSYAGQNILNKVLSNIVPYRAMISFRSITVTFAIITYALITREDIAIPTNYDFWATILICAPCGIIISKYTDFIALENISFFTFSIWQPLKPVLVIIFSILLFNEDFSMNKYIGCGLLVLSSFISSLGKKELK